MKQGIGAVLLVLLVGALPVAAQVQPPQDRIDTAIARALQVGIPVALLERKVAEGKAKGVSLERIAEAVERRQAALERARDAMKGRDPVGDMDLGVAADAVESGVSDAVLRAVVESAPRERRAVAIAALTHLVREGQVPERALERVRDALARGPEALLNLPAEAGRREGGRPEAVPPVVTGRPDGTPAGPPSAVPSPGGSSQPTRPEGRPVEPPRGGDAGRGRP
jgi:hypothetical protein